jgi:hypothetical protein
MLPKIPNQFTPKWPTSCSKSGMHTKTLEFKHLESFKFSDLPSQYGNIWGTFGNIHVLSGPEDQDVDLKINLRSTSHELEIVELLTASQETGSLAFRLSSQSIVEMKTDNTPCIGADIALYFRPGLVLENFRISSPHLGVFVATAMTIRNTTEIILKSGVFSAHPFVSSRRTYIETGGGSVSGVYGLYDLLSIRSQSGSISVDIDPKEIEKEDPKPAVLVVHSQSGSVNVRVSEMDIPKREYRTTVTSRGGSINGNYIHGKITNIEAKSGSIDVDILPYSADDYESTIVMKSQSGSQKVNLLSPYFDPGTPIARLKSTHVVKSGKLQLNYPEEWEGRLYGQTSSGSLNLRGNELVDIEKGSTGGSKWVAAKKGDGDSSLKFISQSGSVDATIGY